MKKALIVVLSVLVLAIVGCSENKGNAESKSLIHEDLQTDIKQIVPIIKESFEKNEEMTIDETDLYDEFYNKYIMGQFWTTDDKKYKMNGLEKAIIREIEKMYMFSYSELRDESQLASNKDAYTEVYKKAKKKFDKYMGMNKIPEKLKDKYPVYERIEGEYPKPFTKDVKELIRLFNPVINGSDSNIGDKRYFTLKDFVDKYSGKEGFEHNNKHYLITVNVSSVVWVFEDLLKEVDKESINYDTMDEFNRIKDKINNPTAEF